MHKQLWILPLAAVLATGCNNNSNNGNGNHDLSMGGDNGDGGVGPDMTPPSDMVDTTPIPVPTTMHVGATGVSAGLVTNGADLAAYLLAPTGTPATGALHVVTKAGVDKAIDTGVSIGGYQLGSDGKSIIYTKAAGQSAALLWADPTAATPTPKTVIATGVISTTLAFAGFYGPSGHYFAVGVLPANVSSSPDMHVIDAHTGTDVYDRLNGEFDYLETIQPDDTMIFQDTAGGTSGTSTPVQTLYWVTLPGATAAAAIATHTSSWQTSADGKTLIILKTSGDLVTWDTTTHPATTTPLVSGAAVFTVGGDTNGPVAYIGADRSVHVIGLDGTKLLDVAATAATAGDVLGTPILSFDNAHLFYWQNVERQENRGTLMHVAVTASATPAKVGDKISMPDLHVNDSSLVGLQNVDDAGQFGDAFKSDLDGGNLVALGTKANVGGLQAVNPGPDTWFAIQLTTAVDDSATNSTIDGSPAIYGALAFEDYTGAAAVALDAKVHAGTFAFAADDGRTAAFVSGATFSATAGNYVGALKLLAARSPSMTVDGALMGVSELGPIVNRSLFVNAPTATTAGVYYVTY
ncbi:MAG TPA: hypothetical protein VGL86_05790 [Polyangia bacterium]|jgi:hypothetical protein